MAQNKLRPLTKAGWKGKCHIQNFIKYKSRTNSNIFWPTKFLILFVIGSEISALLTDAIVS